MTDVDKRQSLDQENNFNAKFGFVYRSSAIFYVLNSECYKTTISLMNYWKYKNNLDANLLISYRDMSGKLVKRSHVEFDGAPVINITDSTFSEGAIEIEAFSSNNLRIPYAAIMAIYETINSVTFVHSYTRNHSLIELEDANCVTSVTEGCWTLKGNDSDIQDFAIFHNGHTSTDKQKGKLKLTNSYFETLEEEFELEALEPYQTMKIYPENIVSNYREFLKAKPGWASIEFENHSSFSRMLICWLKKSNNELQVTHSNFDYSRVKTNLLPSGSRGYMKMPNLFDNLFEYNSILYPSFEPGQYKASTQDETIEVNKSYIHQPSKGNAIEYTRIDGDLPSRLVTGITGKVKEENLPFECSLGIMHKKYPPKRFHWGTVSCLFNSKVWITTYEEIFPEIESYDFCFKLYSPRHDSPIENRLHFSNLSDIPDYFSLDELFINVRELLNDEFGYLSLYSNYHGLVIYTSVEKKNSFSIEHTF